MSVSLKFPLREVGSWLEHETESIFPPVHARAKKLVDEMHRTLDSLVEVSKSLMDNSAKEIEKRNMKTYKRARALNKLARLFYDRIRQMKVPEKVSYDSFDNFIQETQKSFIVTDVDIRNWFPRISPFFILDRRRFLVVFEKAKEQLKEMQNFLTKEYVKTKTLEETFQLVDETESLEKEMAFLKERLSKTGADRESVEKEIAGEQRRIVELRSAGSVGQLHQTGTEIDSLSIEVKHSLQHLQKPFVKLHSLSTHGSGSGLTPEELGKLNQYLENPFEAFSTEEPGHPLLRQILVKLDRAMSDGKLKLKPEKIRKAEQTIDTIINKNGLGSLHQKSREAMTRKTVLSTSQEVAVTKEKVSKIENHIEDLTRRKTVIETDEASIRRSYEETSDKIRNQKSKIEKNILSFLSKTVKVE